MKRHLLAVAALSALLAGCGNTTPATTTGTTAAPSNPIATLNTFTNADLTNAIAIATKAGPAGAPIVSCATYIQGQLTALQGAATLPTGTVGIFTGATLAYLGLNTANSLTSPATQVAYATACGPLEILAVNQGMTLAAQFTALGGQLAALAPVK